MLLIAAIVVLALALHVTALMAASGSTGGVRWREGSTLSRSNAVHLAWDASDPGGKRW
jgi:hypothetical protein